MTTSKKHLLSWQLTAAFIASVACNGGDASKNVGANGRAVFDNAAEASAVDTTAAAEAATADEGAEVVDFDTFVFDGAGVDGAAAGTASQRRWPSRAIISPDAGTVTGRIFDAATGQPITTGTVSTAAACSGRSCGQGTRSRTNLPITRIRFRNGAFAFDAGSRQLTLSPTTTFRIGAPGYSAARIAQGPAGAASDGRSEASPRTTQLPDVYLCRVGSGDQDRDTICDAAEARYGTDPNQQDSDGDMLADPAELYGVWDREVLDIRSLGVDPRQADVLLEIDYAPGRAPTEAGLGAVVAAFEGALPRPNYPNNKPGIKLLAFIDDQLDRDFDIDAPSFTAAGAVVQSYFNLNSAKWPTHYGLFTSWLSWNGERDGSSGYSEGIPGKVFYVTLHDVPAIGYVPSESDQARTLMHELGHNLGLQHGGGESTKYKPNYFSVMNYLYQFDALPSPEPDFPGNPMAIDYSRYETPPLVENALDETVGLQITSDTEGPLFANPRYCTLSDDNPADEERECLCFASYYGGVPGEIDFNRDGMFTTPVAADLNGYNGTNDTIRGTTNDWLSIDFTGGLKVGTQRTVSNPERCPGPPLDLPLVSRTVADGSTVMEPGCPAIPEITNRFAADGGVEDAAVDDAAVEDAATGTDTPLVDSGVPDTTDVTAPIEVDAAVEPVGGELPVFDAGAQVPWGEPEEPVDTDPPPPPIDDPQGDQPLPPQDEQPLPPQDEQPLPPEDAGTFDEEPGDWSGVW